MRKKRSRHKKRIEENVNNMMTLQLLKYQIQAKRSRHKKRIEENSTDDDDDFRGKPDDDDMDGEPGDDDDMDGEPGDDDDFDGEPGDDDDFDGEPGDDDDFDGEPGDDDDFDGEPGDDDDFDGEPGDDDDFDGEPGDDDDFDGEPGDDDDFDGEPGDDDDFDGEPGDDDDFNGEPGDDDDFNGEPGDDDDFDGEPGDDDDFDGEPGDDDDFNGEPGDDDDFDGEPGDDDDFDGEPGDDDDFDGFDGEPGDDDDFNGEPGDVDYNDDSDADPHFGKGSDLDEDDEDEDDDDDHDDQGPRKFQKRDNCNLTMSKAQKRKSDGRCRKRPRKEDAKRQRKQWTCPVEGCSGKVVNLKRHFVQIHRTIPMHEMAAMLKTNPKSKRKLKQWKCPENNCKWEGDRLDKHLQSKAHNFEKSRAKEVMKKVKDTQPVNSHIPKRCCATSYVSCETLADEFYNWYTSIEGGNFVSESLEDHKKKSKVSQNRKVSQMVKSILILQFGNEEFHISRLSELINIGRSSKSVITRLSEGRTWNTVRNYLHCYSHFLDFLEATISGSILPRDTLNSLRVSLKGCIRTVTKMSQEEVQRRKIRDRNRILDWNDVCNYVDSKMARSNMYEFIRQEDHAAKKDLAVNVGTHLLLLIALQNGKRTGSYADMTLQQFWDAEKEEDGYVMLVDDGKTFRVTGAAGIFLSKSEHGLMTKYISECRPLFKPKSDQIFCRPSGERMDTSDILKVIKQGWEEYGRKKGKDVGEINCSLIRKTLVSISRKEGVDRSTQQDMARHMDHSLDTADRHYDVNTGVKITAKFRQIIERFKESDFEESNSEESGSEDNDCYIPVSINI